MTNKLTFKDVLMSAVLVAFMAVGMRFAFASDHFITLDPFTQAELDTDWEADRFFPTDGVTSVTAFGRDDVARLGIDSSETQPGTFQRTEGIKTEGVDDFGTAVEVDLYLDPAWEDTAVRAGFWVVGDDSGARDENFGIIEFINNEPCDEADCSNQTNITDHEGFRIWDSSDGGWADTRNLDTEFEYGEWVTLGIELDTTAGEYIYYIDGVEVGTASGGGDFIREVFLNSYNYGEDDFPTLNEDSYAAHWHVGLPDTEAPDVAITDPADGETVSGMVDIFGTVTDDNPDHYWLVIQDDEGDTVAGPGTVNEDESFTNEELFTWNTTLVPDGTYTIRLEARDEGGNKDAGSVDAIDVTVMNTVVEPEPTDPVTKDECKDGGWEDFGFRNQGQCIRFVNTGMDSR